LYKLDIIKHLIYIFVFFGINCSFLVHAQQPFFKHYTTNKGLAHDITYQIIQDSKGYVWIGTDDGLSRFNGSSFKNYSYENGLKSNYVIDIVEHQPNDFFIATWGEGLHRLKNDTIWAPFYKDNQNGLSKMHTVLKGNDSIFYACTNGRIGRYNINQHSEDRLIITNPNQPKLKRLNKQDISINVKLKQINDTIYVFNHETTNSKTVALKGLYTLTKDNLYPKFQLVLADKIIHSITSKENNTFVSSYNTIYHFKKNGLHDSIKLDLNNHSIYNLEVQKHYFYFIAYNHSTGSREAYSYNTADKTLTNLSKQLDITAFVSDFLIDKNSDLWITTYGQGVYYLPKTQTKFLGSTVFKSSDLRDIAIINDDIYVISPNKLYLLKNDSLSSSITIPFHVENLQADSLKNTLDLIVYDKKFKTKKKASGTTIKTKYSKSYQFKHKDGFLEFKNNSVTVFAKDKNPQTNQVHSFDSYIRKAVKYENKIYVIYDRIGIYIFDAITGELLEKWNKKNGCLTNKFYDIIIYDNGFFLASDMGLISLKNNELKRYTNNDGLLSNHINDLFVDQHNVIWLGTQKGLNVIYNNQFYSINKNKGQLSSFITKITEHKNKIYVTGNNGLFICNNKKPFEAKPSSTLLITQDNSSFFADIINYNNPESIEFDYQLNHQKWQKTQSKHINFSQLKQGNYTVKFRAKDATSSWIYSKPFHFSLRNVWYKQPLLIAFVTCAVLGLVIYIIYKRLKASEKRNKKYRKTLQEKDNLQEELRNVRHQIAKDFHDDLGNKLASISITSNLLLKQDETHTKKTAKRIKQIHKDADDLYGGMRDFIWTLNHKHNTLNELQLYLSEFGEQLFANTEIIFKSNHNIPEHSIEMPYYWNKQLILIFKEAMTNSYKHSRATEVILNVAITNKDLNISFADNGIGFDISDISHINGLKNMKERANSIHGKLTIHKTKGTIIIFNTTLNTT